MFRSAAVTLAAILGLGVPAAPALADSGEPYDLVVSATFDQPAYRISDPIGVRITVRNAGPGKARFVRADPVHGTVAISGPDFGDLQPVNGPGIDLDPGQSAELNLIGHIDNYEKGMPQVARLELSITSRVSPELDSNLDNNFVTLEAPFTIPRGSYRGKILGGGQPLRGVGIQLSGGVPFDEYRQTTDADGNFVFPDITTGMYGASFDAHGGWAIDFMRPFLIDIDRSSPVLIQAKPFLRTLTASVAFTKGTYAVKEPAHLTVVLSNTGTTELVGITTLCAAKGAGHEISLTGSEITLRPGETRAFDESGTVPEGALSWGYVTAQCTFGAPPETAGNPTAFARARVPGGVGGVGSRLVHDRDGDPKNGNDGLSGVDVVLVDPDSHQVVARTVTGADGSFRFDGVPAYRYELRVFGPWKLVDGEVFLQVRDGVARTDRVPNVQVVPGPEQPDPDAPPVPQGGIAARELAATGPIGAVWLAVWGLLAILVGLGLVVASGRRDPLS